MTESKPLPPGPWRILRAGKSCEVIDSNRNTVTVFDESDIDFWISIVLLVNSKHLSSHSPDSSPIPPERVPEALRELAWLTDAAYGLSEALGVLPADIRFNLQVDRYSDLGSKWLRAEASRLEAELAKGGAR